jgi:hypothetical protein
VARTRTCTSKVATIARQLLPWLCPLCPSDDGIDASHNQADTAVAKLAGFECDLLHIAEVFSSPRCSFLRHRHAGQDAIPHRKITASDAAQPKSSVQKPCVPARVAKQWSADGKGWVRAMSQSDAGFDFDRYRRLLAEADDEPKRLAFINLLVDEKAKDKLAGQALRGRLAELGLKANK